jgi:DNA-binding transcriptional LysR family regulator
VITDFLAAYPNVDVRLVQSDRLAHLVDDQIDCAIRIGELPDSGMTALRLGTVRRMVLRQPFLPEKASVDQEAGRYRGA